MKHRTRLIASALPLALLGGGMASGALLPAVLPMETQVYRESASQSLAIRFTGRLPVAAANERVVLRVRECNARFFRQVGGARTGAGGMWQMEVGGGYGFPFSPSGSTYVVRWKDRATSPFTWRTRISPGVTKVGARARVEVNTGYATPIQNLTGREVILQRLSDGRYVDVRRAKLRALDARRFTATFALGTRGLTMRVLVPTRTARPCYNAGASGTFTS